jgi:mannose-6-phosphate isomerase
MSDMSNVNPLRGVVKKYDWGGYQFIADLLQTENVNNEPMAEYWMGVHPQGISIVENSKGESSPLNSIVDLPFLFKVLDVKDMLSIQVHPSKKDAILEFNSENERGIALTDPKRNYKDANHKPELMVALSDFWLLHGFKEKGLLLETFSSTSELTFLISVFEKGGYEALYKNVMEMPQQLVNEHLRPLIERILGLYKAGKLSKDTPDFWAARAFETFSKDGSIDRGIFSIYFFNLLGLKKGEAIFQDAGVPHAYLEGQNVEIMANSDNVLRGGLTSKHIDVKELLKHVKFEAVIPDIRTATDSLSWFDVPVNDFRLGQLKLNAGAHASVSLQNPSIILLVEGVAEVDNSNGAVLKKGNPVVFSSGDTIRLKGLENALIFIAQQGIHSR